MHMSKQPHHGRKPKVRVDDMIGPIFPWQEKFNLASSSSTTLPQEELLISPSMGIAGRQKRGDSIGRGIILFRVSIWELPSRDSKSSTLLTYQIQRLPPTLRNPRRPAVDLSLGRTVHIQHSPRPLRTHSRPLFMIGHQKANDYNTPDGADKPVTHRSVRTAVLCMSHKRTSPPIQEAPNDFCIDPIIIIEFGARLARKFSYQSCKPSMKQHLSSPIPKIPRFFFLFLFEVLLPPRHTFRFPSSRQLTNTTKTTYSSRTHAHAHTETSFSVITCM
ncbi:hypothetical protein QBC43DRAFT_322081 [Cladorrhinum sp. PSN259]|nr:hypothetical protein QBC43DRAFT_322081 [Cladorrhinum sp. PSN259]